MGPGGTPRVGSRKTQKSLTIMIPAIRHLKEKPRSRSRRPIIYETNPAAKPETIPGLVIGRSTRLGVQTADYKTAEEGTERRIVIEDGLVRLHLAAIASNVFLLGRPQNEGSRLSVFNFTPFQQRIRCSATAHFGEYTAPMTMSPSVPHRISGRFDELELQGVGSNFELLAYHGAWVMTRSHLTEGKSGKS